MERQFAMAAAVLSLALVLTGLVRAVAKRLALFDHPGDRKVHVLPTPNLGGIAVAVATAGGAFAGILFGFAERFDGMGALIGAAGLVSLLGLVDDLRPLGARTRLVVETVAATAVVMAAGLSLLAGMLAVVWIVFTTNAFNLFDNSDGALSTVAAVISLGLMGCATADGRPGFALLLNVLAAALLGFLPHNWHPAKIFLGDCGSLFTGFLIASSAVTLHSRTNGPRLTAELFALTFVVITDTLLVLVSRYRARRPLLQGGADHIAHRLRRIGLNPPAAAAVMGLAAGVGTVLALLVHAGRLAPITVVPLALTVPVVIVLLLRVSVYGPNGTLLAPMRRVTASLTDVRGGRP